MAHNVDNLENNKVNSSPYASYENEELGMSIDLSQAPATAKTPAIVQVATSSPTAKPDQYTEAETYPEILTLDSNVPISDPKKFGGRTSITLRDLIEEAGSLHASIANRAQGELVKFIQGQLASQVNTSSDQSFADADADMANALKLLLSQDPKERKAGAQILANHILANQDNVELQRGLVITLSKVGNHEALEALADVYRHCPSDSPLRKTIAELSNSHEVLQVVAQNNSAQKGNETGNGGIGNFKALSAVGPTEFFGKGISSANNAALLDKVTELVASHIARSPELQGVMDSNQAEPIAQKLLAISQNSEPNKNTYYRLAVLEAGWLGLTSTAQPFISITKVATDIARDVSRILPSSSLVPGNVNGKSYVAPAQQGPVDWSSVTVSSEDSITQSQPTAQAKTARGFLDSLLQVATQDSNSSKNSSYFVSIATTVNAGMQGAISFLSSAQGNPLGAMALGPNAKPSYFIEGTTALDGEGTSDHHDENSSGGHSGGQNDGQTPYQDQSQSDSYLS